MKKKWSVKKKILMSILAVIAVLLLVVIGYVVYVFASYHRIDDKQNLKINSLNGDETLKVTTDNEYTIGTLMPSMAQQIWQKVEILILCFFRK